MPGITADFIEAVFEAREPRPLEAGGIRRLAHDISGIPGVDRLPNALKVLLENVVRCEHDDAALVERAHAIVSAGLAGEKGGEIEFMPSRVLFQDFTGVPVFVDFAAMRDAAAERSADPALVNPRIPCTLIIDHSVIADVAGCEGAAAENERIEAERNAERFAFLKWAAGSFDNVEIVPPGGGICHQLNIERFCKIAATDALAEGDEEVACFDTLVGTDSHTTTANGIGCLGWGVGGIEAEAAALGQPISMLVPEVVELRLTGAPGPLVSGMDIALTVCERLRAAGVVGSLVEATGEGVAALSATQRSAIANMTPEYGATVTLFPVDDKVVDYLALTGRDEGEIAFARAFCELEGAFGSPEGRVYARTVEIDLAAVEPSLAGPSRPHNRVAIPGLKERFEKVASEHGRDLDESFTVEAKGETCELSHGAVALAAITSCTTATDPAMMVAAGLLAKRACEKGLHAKPWVKTILAPGSHAASLLLERAGLMEPLRELGFNVCGYGCMSCIGNSGPVLDGMHEIAERAELASVLSGNRNFDGRISPDVAQNFLAQPALVVAYALAGTVRCDLATEPLGADAEGAPVYLADIMPTAAEIDEVLASALDASVYVDGMADLMEGSAAWRAIASGSSTTFAWDEDSTYIRRAPYFELAEAQTSFSLERGRVLALLGDFVTTDHISPAGSIAADSPAARYLGERGVERADFNTYGARRGNHEVMMRGTLANTRLENALADGRTGGWTKNLDTGEICPIFDASRAYAEAGEGLAIIAGKMYGSGSSRDWAAKGVALLGVRAVIAESFERIHRSNLVQMGVLPLEFLPGEGAAALGLDGTERITIDAIAPADIAAGATARVTAEGERGSVSFEARIRIDTATESEIFFRGGILPYVLDQLIA